ncbi:MAG: phage portal protein, partial [Gemmatimonadota bacterium]
MRDVVHLRYGLDPRDPKHGMSRLKPVLREVMTDREASTFSAAILSNMGVPGGVIAPKDAAAVPTDDDVKDMKEYMKNFRGGRRGDWLVLGTPTEIGQFGFNPQNLMLGNLRDISEERVCAALGIHTAVVGFGSG